MSSSRRDSLSLRGLWATASLRLALTFAAIFGLGGALLVVGVDFGLYRFVESEVRAGLSHQMAVMEDDEARLGGKALIDMLEAQPSNRQARRYLLLVVTPDGNSFSNGLTRAAVNDEGFRRITGDKPRAARWPDQRPNMLVLSHTTADGTLLAVGRDIHHLEELSGGVRTFAIWSGASIIALALVAGLITGYLFLRRLERVNDTIGRIISGNVSERLPAIGFGREFDDLAHNLNLMLERQEAMMEALKTVSEGIAHDLRTPLGRLRNRLDELETAADDPVRRQASIEFAVQEINQITALFEALLALSRLESGASASQTAELDAGELLAAVGEMYRPAIEDAGGTLEISPSPMPQPPAKIIGDGALLVQAMSNLVENAIVHSTGRADIALEIGRSGEHVAITVADRGPGIPESERRNVLKRFYRMDRSRSRPGSGIGLAMCAAVAHWHGGELILADNAPGLRVTLMLPAAA